MARYHRINIDGKSLSKTETRTVLAALLPGTLAVINAAGKFIQAAATKGRMYVIGCGEHQGLGIREAIPAGDSAVGNYVEEGREIVLLCDPGTYLKDTPIKLGLAGKGAVSALATESVIGYSQDTFTIPAATTEFIRVRMRVGTAAGVA